MLLHIDTAVLRSAVSVAEQTNSSISDAASLLNQITVHEDWICKERDQIKQMTLANKQTAQDIENRAENFYKAIQNASQKFDEKEPGDQHAHQWCGRYHRPGDQCCAGYYRRQHRRRSYGCDCDQQLEYRPQQYFDR